MKITVYLFVTDDDGGTNSQAFATEAERDAAIWEWLAEQDGDASADELCAKYDDDYGEAYENGARNYLDTANWDDQEIEIPDPVPAETEKAYIGIRLEGGLVQDVFSNRPEACPVVYVIDYDTEGADEDELTEIKGEDGSSDHAVLSRYDKPTMAENLAWFERLDAEFDGDAAPSSAETGEDDPENPNRYTNHYECDCGTTWQDNWSCTCNDRCPSCNLEIEPWQSVDNDTHETIKH